MSDLNTMRTDVVGSLLRPAGLQEARGRFDEGEIDAAALAAIEDDAVREAVRLQEGVGLDVVSDGEMRRLNFQDSFGAAVEGYDAVRLTAKAHVRRVAGGKAMQRFDIPDLRGGTAVAHRRPAGARLRLARNVPLEEYAFVAPGGEETGEGDPDRARPHLPALRLPGLDRRLQRPRRFAADVVAIERQMIEGLVAAGCRYVQIDAPGYTAYVDPPSLAAMRERGEDPMENFSRSLKADAEVMRGFPGVTFGIHLCRGNQHSMWHREGTYDAIAERLFTELPHHRFLLEYDSPRAGSFAPLRFLPKGKVAVLGLISTKVPELEAIDELRRRIEEASGTCRSISLRSARSAASPPTWSAISSAPTTRSASSRWWWRPRGRSGVNKCEGTPPRHAAPGLNWAYFLRGSSLGST